jgi:hypothetical protein
MSTRVLANGFGFPGSRHTLPHRFDERGDTSFRGCRPFLRGQKTLDDGAIPLLILCILCVDRHFVGASSGVKESKRKEKNPCW